MKSILIIGMSRFAQHLCENLLEYNNQIMIVDKNEERVETLASRVTTALVADCTKEDVLKNIGVSDFDICFVCMGDDFLSNLEVTCILKDLGAKYVVSLSRSTKNTKFLLRNGADEVIHPDKDVAARFAVTCSNDNLFDYIELEEDYSIYEITPISDWINKTLVESNIRAKYNISIIGIKDLNGKLNIAPSAQYTIKDTDHLVVIAHDDDIKKVLNGR